ncbi:MAG TPA: hypothetical protein VFP98_04460 [Candidatus Polarisedimenticolia bacterium]|nr:hypothetical protein [Candidatus Polarisedimenticolia bacterium]
MRRIIRFMPAAAFALGAASGQVAAAGSPAGRMLVVCSPGSPGDTIQAQPTMDAFALEAARAAGRPEGSLRAVYHESLESGLAALKSRDSALAMLPVPLFLRYEKELALEPLLAAVPDTGPTETWSLVARRGAAASAAGMDGWEILGTIGYAESFVRRVAAGRWGPLPDGARVGFTARPLSALRRAASGERVAVVLDRSQTDALASLPFGKELEAVGSSMPLPGGLLCSVGTGMPEAEKSAYVRALSQLQRTEQGRATLESLRMKMFAPLSPSDREALEAARKAAQP